MFVRISFSDGLAIYEQVVRQVKFAVAAAAIKPGEMVPSVRQLARQLAINPNTVARAYRQLQAEGVLQPVRGTGLAVAEGAPQRCRDQRVRLIQQRLRQVLAEARHSGLQAEQLRALVDEELQALQSAEQ